MDLQTKFRERYKDVALEDASKYYYGRGNAMDWVLGKMQEGIDAAAAVYDGIKQQYENPHVTIYIDQDHYRMTFSIAEYDEEEGGPAQDRKAFFSHEVEEAMAEALVLMRMMEDSHRSTGMSQATNNWAEDLNVEHFGEFTLNVDIADCWEHIEY